VSYASIPNHLAYCKRQIEQRLDKSQLGDCSEPVLKASNIHYEVADRVHGICYGGIGSVHLLARNLGLIDAINDRLHLLKFHFPYFESDHVLNFAYNGTEQKKRASCERWLSAGGMVALRVCS